uniref:Uncharacterized protein n=1 Tax=Oryza barthii TaxID=65489 RepID=A0A0D3GEF9_9ORYZ
MASASSEASEARASRSGRCSAPAAAALSSDAFIDHYLRLAKRRRGLKLCVLPDSAFADTVSAWSPETPAKAATTSSGKVAAATSGRQRPGKSCRCWAWAALEELGWCQRRSRRPPRRRPPDLLSRLAPAGLMWLFLIYFGKQTVGEDVVRRDSADKEDEWMTYSAGIFRSKLQLTAVQLSMLLAAAAAALPWEWQPNMPTME